jgi:hypothetical protein
MTYTNVGPPAPLKYILPARGSVRGVSCGISRGSKWDRRGEPGIQEVWGATYAAKDSQPLDALHKVMAEMRTLH